MIVHLEPGTTLLVRYRSAEILICLGSSPTGTWSGASCSFSICWSMNWHFSCTTKYGSSGHLSVWSPSVLFREHTRGSVMPAIPPLTTRFSVCWQFRHWIFRAVALDESVDAPMTMPGMRTRWEMFVALRSRIEIWETEECRRSWCSGRRMSSAFLEG